MYRGTVGLEMGRRDLSVKFEKESKASGLAAD